MIESLSFVCGVADAHLAGVGSMVLYFLMLVEVDMLQKRFVKIDTSMFYVYICRISLHPCNIRRAARKILFISMYLVIGSYLFVLWDISSILHMYVNRYSDKKAQLHKP